MTERNELRTPGNPVLERIAWNAAALAVLAVLMLVLLGSLEWLDHLAGEPSTRMSPPRIARAGIGPPFAEGGGP